MVRSIHFQHQRIPIVADDFSELTIKYKSIRLTVGHPVSAMYIVALFGRDSASSTSFPWKKVAVQAAESSADTLANHGCTLAIWDTVSTN